MTTRLLFPVMLFIPVNLFGQFHRTFLTVPDSAKITVNGIERCHAPCVVKYTWKEAVQDKLIFDVSAPGYTSWQDTLTGKPRVFDDLERISLERAIPDYAVGATSGIVGFDKLLADIKDGTVIGAEADKTGKTTPIKWEGSVKVGEKAFERRFYEVLNKAGLRTPTRPDPKLFSDGERPQLPRYLVGVQLIDVAVDISRDPRKDLGDGCALGRTRLSLDWKVLDRSTGKVVKTIRTSGRSTDRQRSGYAQSDNLAAFEDALLKFLAEGSFVELVRTNTSPLPSDIAAVDTATASHTIKRVPIPEFKNLSEMIRYADRSCVTIITDGGHGSGVIINSEGYVLSAQHVVDGTNRIEVQFSDGLRQDASIVFADVDQDLVLLDIAGSGFRPLPVAENDSTGLGDEVVTIGTPADVALGQSISKGILSGKRKFEERIYLQTDVAVSPGNSGGPLLNARGEVIGIIQSKITGDGIEGLGFAMPMDEVIRRLHILIQDQK